jgi:hypothetical protein
MEKNLVEIRGYVAIDGILYNQKDESPALFFTKIAVNYNHSERKTAFIPVRFWAEKAIMANAALTKGVYVEVRGTLVNSTMSGEIAVVAREFYPHFSQAHTTK